MQGMNDLYSLTLGEIHQEKNKVENGYFSAYRDQIIDLEKERYQEPETD